jgi:mRNA-degrading endonuclease toxin of MazEF toxin-antitoxin module
LLLSRPDAYQYLNKFLAAGITTAIRDIPVEVPLGPAGGLRRKCVANCDNLRTIACSSLVKRLGALAPARHSEVKRAVGYALGWEELIEVP